MKVKQKVETSGRFVKPDVKDILVPEIVVCPECGSFIYPNGEDKGRTYYFPNITNEHRYHKRHYASGTFTCSDCGCKFSRTVNTYTEFNWDKIAYDISKVIAILLIILKWLCILGIGIHNIIARIVIIILSCIIVLVLLKYYWRNE